MLIKQQFTDFLPKPYLVLAKIKGQLGPEISEKHNAMIHSAGGKSIVMFNTARRRKKLPTYLDIKMID